MSYFKAKMHQIRFQLGPQTPRWGSSQCSPRSPSCFFVIIKAFVGSEKVLENFSWGSFKVLDFFVSKRVGTLIDITVVFQD